MANRGRQAPAAARARLNNLADRNSRLVRAISDERAVTRQLEENSAAREGALGSIRRIYSDAALTEGDLSGLILLLGSLQRYRELNSEKTSLEGQIGLDCTELERAGEPELAECDGLSLVPLKDSLANLAMRAGGLRSEIAEITASINEAKRGRALQDFIAVREENPRETAGPPRRGVVRGGREVSHRRRRRGVRADPDAARFRKGPRSFLRVHQSQL